MAGTPIQFNNLGYNSASCALLHVCTEAAGVQNQNDLTNTAMWVSMSSMLDVISSFAGIPPPE